MCYAKRGGGRNKGGRRKKGGRKKKVMRKDASPGIEPRTFRVVGQTLTAELSLQATLPTGCLLLVKK